MFSCSKYAFVKKKGKKASTEAPDVIKEEDWEIDSDELNENFDSDDEEAKVAKPKERVMRKGRKFKTEIDTNVMSIALKCLKDDAQLASGDPIMCEACDGVFNIHSTVETDEEENQFWNCEFCGNKNEVVIDENEKPTKDSLNYVLENEEAAEEKKTSEAPKAESETPIIFCIDISGSMGSSGSMNRQRRRNRGPSSQKASRYQHIATAINAHLATMKETKRKVGFVTFNSQVQVIGDSTEKPQIIAGKDLHDYDYLLENGQGLADSHMQKGVNVTLNNLQEIIMSTRPRGGTALGPAALTSISMTGQCGNGATVVICTDGLSNQGIGNLNGARRGEYTQDQIDEFYENLADHANQNGVSVNLISIKGQDCDLETLMTLSDKTGGEVNIIDPENASVEFSNVLNSEAIATRVTVKVLLHKALEFKNENPNELSKNNTLLTKKVGNAGEETEINFSYKLKEEEDLEKIEGFSLEEISEIPFQAVIEYTKLDGMKCIRTITKILKVSDDAEEVQKDADMGILAVTAAQQASTLARHGRFREAQALTVGNKRFMKKNMKSENDQKMYKAWKRNMNDLYDQVHVQNNMEEMADVQMQKMPDMDVGMASKKKKKGFFSKMGDSLSSNLNKQSRFNTKSLKM